MTNSIFFLFAGRQQPPSNADSEERPLRRLQKLTTLGPHHPTPLKIRQDPHLHPPNEEE